MATALKLLSVVIPARNEESCVAATVEHLHRELETQLVPHEIVVVDDDSTDRTWDILSDLSGRIRELRPIRNTGPHGFGRAVVKGFGASTGDAFVVMMADESDAPADVVRYWLKLNEGYDCVFGSRFLRGSSVTDYPKFKLAANRVVNLGLRLMFNIKLNDTTNAFKAYRREVVEGCQPLIAPHFNLTVELPLKSIVRGYRWAAIPISWKNRRTGATKLSLKEMGSRYLFIVLYVWLEKYFSRGDYHRIRPLN